MYFTAESVLRLLELCSTCIPRVPSLSTVQRTASLLPKMLTIYTKKSLDVQFHFVTEAYCLLLAALKQEDKQGEIIIIIFIKVLIHYKYII